MMLESRCCRENKSAAESPGNGGEHAEPLHFLPFLAFVVSLREFHLALF